MHRRCVFPAALAMAEKSNEERQKFFGLATSGLGCKPPGASPLSTPLCSIIFSFDPARVDAVTGCKTSLFGLGLLNLTISAEIR